ncbi:hypothetical protein [Streptomyces sp. G45]|uniref:hypothetical protein n=1 Tax=Streptomyces sp. G45 TaxID=3406627 RepID=UPI003C135E74
MLLGSDAFRAALDHTTGVLSLVALTASVAWGLVASDRLFLRSRERLLAQAVHRATAVASVGFLLLHGTVKLALDHVSYVGALVPFGLGFSGSAGLIGLGSLAGLLMVATGVTGALRSAFASPVRIAARWRALHMLAYPAWCAALLHGLYAGRPPKAWVIALYCLCLVAVAGAVALRAAPRPVKLAVAARVLALLEPDDRGAPPRSRCRRAAAPPDRDTDSAPLPGTGGGHHGGSLPDKGSAVGIAAAYRALTAAAEHDAADLPPGLQPTATTRWPTPTPPPPVTAPATGSPYATAYDSEATAPTPVETGYAGYAPVEARYDSTDPRHDYGDARFGHPDSGPDAPTATGHGPFQAPSTGEPWNAATGGGK